VELGPTFNDLLAEPTKAPVAASRQLRQIRTESQQTLLYAFGRSGQLLTLAQMESLLNNLSLAVATTLVITPLKLLSLLA
jgi:hypothetical protein